MAEEQTAPTEESPDVDNSSSGKNGAPSRVAILIPVHTECKVAKKVDDRSFYEVTPTVMRALQIDYPTLDVRGEVARMILYYESNEAKRWKLPMRGMRDWLDKSAGKKTGRKRVFSKKAAVLKADWWKTDQGILDKGHELGIARIDGEPFLYYKARVCDAMGDGPWMDSRNYTFMRILGEVRMGAEQSGSLH